MEPKPRSIGGVVFGALLIVLALWLIVRIMEAIWLPLLIIGLVAVALGVAGWLLYRRNRRW
jgi:LPXTG-motif cell wall-anchored protein